MRFLIIAFKKKICQWPQGAAPAVLGVYIAEGRGSQYHAANDFK